MPSPGSRQARTFLCLSAILGHCRRHAGDISWRTARSTRWQALADRMEAGGDPAARASLLYALGNAHLRRALDAFKTDPMRQIAPIINLAKLEYRQSLQIDPDNWDARYNYDIAAALVREADGAPPNKGHDMARERALWPDVPGAPNGLP